MSKQTDLIDFITELSSGGADMQDHFYDILRVHPSAEQEVIESAYRRLLRLYHPDVNKHPMANDMTKVLISTYEILGDPVKRAEYDAYIESKKSAGQITTPKADREGQIAFYIERGEAYETNDKHDLAIQDFTKVIELDPYNNIAYQWRGCLYGQVNIALAIKDYTKAIELDPANWVAYRSRSSAYFYNGDSNLAAQDYTKAEELFTKHPSSSNHEPDSVQGLLRYFTFGVLIGDTCKIRSNTGKADFLKLVDFYTQLQDGSDGMLKSSPLTKWDSNIQKYTEAINLYPHRSSNYKFRGNAYIREGEFRLAIEDFDKAIELNPSSPSNYERRSKAYAHLGELELAEEDINTAMWLRAEQQRASSAKKRPTPESSASPRAATNERTRAQPAGNSSTFWTQTHTSPSETQTSNRISREVSDAQESSIVGQAVFGGIVFAIIAGAIEALIVIFWNDTAASIVGALLLILVAWCIWGNKKLSFGLKGLLTLCGMGSILGFGFIMWVIGIDSDKVGYVGLAAIMGGALAVTLAITPAED